MDLEKLGLSEEQTAAVGEFISGISSEMEAIKAKNDELLTEAKRAKDAKRQEEEQSRQAREEAERLKALKDSDVESLNKSWQEKYESLESEYNGLQTQVKTNTIDGIANGWVSQNVVDDPIVRRAIAQDMAKRLDLRDGKPAVLDADGNLTALSIDDLQKEFSTRGDLKAHLVATNANGGGAAGSDGGSGGSSKSLKSVTSVEERTAVIKQNLAARGL